MAKEKMRCGSCGALVRYEAKAVKAHVVPCEKCKHETPVEARAVARFVKTTPRKLRLIADAIRGKSVREALTLLRFTPKRAASVLKEVVESARANAEHTYQMNPDNLLISNVFVDGGPVLKRFMPRAMGRSATVRKRMSHITVKVREAASAIQAPKKKQRVAARKSEKPRPQAEGTPITERKSKQNQSEA